MTMLLRTASNRLATGLALMMLWTGSAAAGIHTWQINEVFSDATGQIQYIELQDVGTGGAEVNIGNATVTSNTQSHTMANGTVAPPTNGRFYLIATPDFAALPGAPTPDEILPAGVVPFFATSGDTVGAAFDSYTFGAVPTDGVNALDRAGTTLVNTPTNYAGATGSVNAAPPPPTVPLSSWPAVVGMLAMIVGLGTTAFARRPAQSR